MKYWIMVADAARARFFETDLPKGEWVELEDRVHYASRLHGHELETDAPARVHDSLGPGRHAMEPSTNIREQETDTFARELSRHLTEAHNANRFQKLYLVAAPHFLGLLRSHLDKGVAGTVAGGVGKDLVQHSLEDIRAHLPEAL
jgi:protein required for attachment to host cells